MPGSVNLQLASVVSRLPQFAQGTIAERQGSPPPEALADSRLILVKSSELSWKQKMMLRLPCSLRQRWYCGIGGRGSLAYAWRVLDELRRLRPKVVVAYDMPWIGQILRKGITWPCRLVLSQHGLSYFLEGERAASVYSLTSFDEVRSLTRVSYRVDRERLPQYEPLVSIIPNSIDVDRFRPVSAAEKLALRAKWNLPQHDPVVLTLSVLRPKKGIHAVLASWGDVLRRFPRAILWVVGGGDSSRQGYGKELQAMAQRLGVANNVVFQGPVSPRTTHECYQAADLYVFPTLFVEGFPLSLAEALATGLPCIASDHKVAREAYDDSQVTFVNDPNVAGAFVPPILDLLENPRRREQLGHEAREMVRRLYSPQAVDPLWIRFFQRQLQLAGHAPDAMVENPAEPNSRGLAVPGTETCEKRAVAR